MRKTKMEKGITLIALIITIVVLLILAVVAINSITNDGLLGKAENSADKYNQSVKNEQDTLGKYVDVLEKYKANENNEKAAWICSFESDVYNNIPVVSVMDGIGLNAIEINNNKLNITTNSNNTEQLISLDIKKNETYGIDYIDLGPVLGRNLEVPGLLVDSEWNAIKDLSNNINLENYYIFVIDSEETIQKILTSSFYTCNSFYVSREFEDIEMKNYELLNIQDGLSTGIVKYLVHDGNGDVEYGYLDENFEEAQKLVDTLKKQDDAEISDSDSIWTIKSRRILCIWI